MSWSRQFNTLPFETRVIACAIELEHQIRDAKLEKNRLRLLYRDLLREQNARLKRLQKQLETCESEVNDLAASPPATRK